MRPVALAVFALAALALAAPALAQAPSTMSYQGVLTDAVGNIVPDGNYDLTFRIYDASVLGAPLWTEALAAVPVEKGGFSVILGQVTTLNLAFDRQYWLGVQVLAEAELVPRIKLASAPSALSLKLPFSQSLISGSSLLSLENFGAGAALSALGRLDVGSTTHSGELRLFRNGSAANVLRGYTGTHGGSLDLFEDTGSTHLALQADVNGTGGFLDVFSTSAGGNGFIVDGNAAGAQTPVVSILGTASTSFFDTRMTGDDAVELPSGAISSLEESNEPGVAYAADDAIVTLDGTLQTLMSRTITVPAAGYVVAIGCFQLNVSHTNGVRDLLTYGLSTSSASLPPNQDFAYDVPSAYPTANHFPTPGCTAIFPVSAGANTIYLLGQEVSGVLSINDIALSLMYFPTAYGTVSSAAPQSVTGGGDELRGPMRGGLAAREIASEQEEARAFHDARVARELATMRAKLEALEREMAASRGQQAAGARD